MSDTVAPPLDTTEETGPAFEAKLLARADSDEIELATLDKMLDESTGRLNVVKTDDGVVTALSDKVAEPVGVDDASGLDDIAWPL